MLSESKCPECGKKVIVRFMGETTFCSDVCKKNYEYKKKFEKPKFK